MSLHASMLGTAQALGDRAALDVNSMGQGLSRGARWLAPSFARPRAWQVLDALIGVTMWVLSLLLVRLVMSGL